MFKKKVVACIVKRSTPDMYGSVTDISENYEPKRKKNIDLLSLEKTFMRKAIFFGTCLCEHKGDFSINPEIFNCEEDDRPHEIGHISFEFRIKDQFTEICNFKVVVDFEGRKISLDEIRVDDSYQKQGIMKRTLFNIFDLFVQEWPELKTFEVRADEIQHIAVLKFLLPDLTKEELPPCKDDGRIKVPQGSISKSMEDLYKEHYNYLAMQTKFNSKKTSETCLLPNHLG